MTSGVFPFEARIRDYIDGVDKDALCVPGGHYDMNRGSSDFQFVTSPGLIGEQLGRRHSLLLLS